MTDPLYPEPDVEQESLTFVGPLDWIAAYLRISWPFFAVVAVVIVGLLATSSHSMFARSIGIFLLLGSIFGIIRTVGLAFPRSRKVHSGSAVTPVGYTTDGQPIYPVVGYTPDGLPVTADRAVGLRPAAVGTNSMSVAALIMGLTIAPLGVVFGHIALSQIKRTGQSGRGLAIAGLVLGYISVGVMVAALLSLA